MLMMRGFADADDVRRLLDQDCTEARFLHDQE